MTTNARKILKVQLATIVVELVVLSALLFGIYLILKFENKQILEIKELTKLSHDMQTSTSTAPRINPLQLGLLNKLKSFAVANDESIAYINQLETEFTNASSSLKVMSASTDNSGKLNKMRLRLRLEGDLNSILENLSNLEKRTELSFFKDLNISRKNTDWIADTEYTVLIKNNEYESQE